MSTEETSSGGLRWVANCLRPHAAILLAGVGLGASAVLWNYSPAGAVAALAAGLVLLGVGARWMAARMRGLRRVEDAVGHLAAWTAEGDSEFSKSGMGELRRSSGANGGARENGGERGKGGERGSEFSVLEQRLEELADRLAAQVKDAARKSRNLEALIDALDEPVLATDNDDRVLLFNRAAEALLGEKTGRDAGSTLKGRAFADLFTQDEVVEMHQAARRGERRGGRVRLVTPLGTRTMHVSAAPVPVAWGEGVFGAVLVLQDVTELAQAVQVKTDFVANASHDLRTPVAAIRGAAETLGDAVEENPAMAARLAAMILSHTERLEEMLRDLLDLSRLESMEGVVRSEVVDLEALVAALRRQFDHACSPRGLELEFEIDEHLQGVRSDPALLDLVLRNLIENAVKFSHDNTTIHVRASLVEEVMPSRASLPRGAGGGARRTTIGTARFEVEDTGIGIPLQHQQRVFERYYQVDPARTTPAGMKRGTGLGLAIVKHAAKALGGRVGLRSVWGEGTRVWAEWPVELEVVSSDDEM